MAQHSMGQPGTAQHGAAWHSMAQHGNVWGCTVQHGAAQDETVRHSTAQHLRIVVGQWLVAPLQTLQIVAEAAFMHASLGHCTSPLHQVECHHGQSVTLCCFSKAKYVKVPVVLCILHTDKDRCHEMNVYVWFHLRGSPATEHTYV